MRFRNKKTGEIGHLTTSRGIDHYLVANDEWESRGKYNTLAELMAEWEEYEDPKEYWWIDGCGGALQDYFDGGCIDIQRKQIGNYFETKEEAGKAVEKLKAWKRLKDKGLKFERPYTMHDHIKYDVDNITGELKVDRVLREDREIRADLDLLFGGED